MNERVGDLERRIGHERQRIDETLGELEHRLAPRRLMDQGLDHLKHRVTALLGSWGRAMKRNPLPLALTAIGLTWAPGLRRHPVPLALTTVGLTMLARSAGEREAEGPDEPDRWHGRGQAYEYGAPASKRNGHAVQRDGLLQRARHAAHDLKQQVDETAEAFAERVAHAQGEVLGLVRRAGESAGDFVARVGRTLEAGAESVGETVQQGVEAAGDYAGRIGSAVSHGAQSIKENVMHGAESARELAQRGREQAGTFLREQPLLALALGVGFGALLGALLPTTPIERRNIGPLAERARDEVRQRARSLGDTAKRVAGDAVAAATTGAERAMHRWEDEAGGGDQRSRH